MEQELIQFGECHKTMSSLEIAEVIGKPHNDIMKAIRKMEPAWEKVAQGKFSRGTYQDKNNQARPCYNLTYRETLFVASKFKDEERARLILRWESLETGQAQPMFQQPKSGAEMLLLYAQQMVEQERRVNAIENKVKQTEKRIAEIEARTVTSLPYTTIVGYANRFGIRCPRERASVLGRVATNLCKQYGFEMGRVEDPRFGMVKTYPDGVLHEVFEKYYPNMTF